MRKYNIGVTSRISNDKDQLWVADVKVQNDGTIHHTLTPWRDEAKDFTHDMNLTIAKLDFNQNGYNYVIKKYNIR